MLTITLIIVIGLYLASLLSWRLNWTFGNRTTRKFRGIHFAFLILLILLAILGGNNVFLRGYWTTKVIIWIFVITAMTLFAFGHRPIQRTIERLYCGLFFYIPLILIPISFIPFLGVGVLLTIHGYTIGDRSDIKYSDNKFRLQQTYRGFLAPAGPPDLFVKRGMFEYKEKPLAVPYFGEADSIKIKELGKNRIEIEFYHNGQFTDRENPIKETVEIGS